MIKTIKSIQSLKVIKSGIKVSFKDASYDWKITFTTLNTELKRSSVSLETRCLLQKKNSLY